MNSTKFINKFYFIEITLFSYVEVVVFVDEAVERAAPLVVDGPVAITWIVLSLGK